MLRHLILACVVVGAIGCSKYPELARARKIEKLYPDQAPATRPAPRSGTYVLATRGSSDRLRPDVFTLLDLNEGQSIGFARGSAGGVVAVAGDRTFPLAKSPGDSIAWYYLPSNRAAQAVRSGLVATAKAASVACDASACFADEVYQRWYEDEQRRDRERSDPLLNHPQVLQAKKDGH